MLYDYALFASKTINEQIYDETIDALIHYRTGYLYFSTGVFSFIYEKSRDKKSGKINVDGIVTYDWMWN